MENGFVALPVLPCFTPLSLFQSLSLSSHTVSPTEFPSRTCSAACETACQILRRHPALRMGRPWSPRIHHAFYHNVMCLFDTWHSSCTEFTSSSCPTGPQLLLLTLLLLSTHRSLAPPDLWRLLRSPLLSRLLRSPLLSRIKT